MIASAPLREVIAAAAALGGSLHLTTEAAHKLLGPGDTWTDLADAAGATLTYDPQGFFLLTLKP